jgi:hypothetical protein
MPNKKVCIVCGDLLQRWEIGYHIDCGKMMGYPEAEVDLLELNDERIEREINKEYDKSL